MILLSGSKHKISTAERYIDEISQADDLPVEEIEKNRERNADLLLDHIWTVEQFFMFYKHKLNCPSIVTRTGFSVDRGMRQSKLYDDYFKECTFKPKITRRAQEIEEKKISMFKINQSLDVFDANKQELDTSDNVDKNNSKNGSAHKTTNKKNPKSTFGRLKKSTKSKCFKITHSL